MSRNFSKRWWKKDRGIRITFQAKPSQVHGRGEGTRVRWAARLEADERISRVSLNTRRTSSRLLLAWRVCVGVPWRTSRGKANRLHTHTRSRDRRESPHYRATHSPFLTSCACPSLCLFVCFRPLILFYPLPLSLHWNLFSSFSKYFWKFYPCINCYFVYFKKINASIFFNDTLDFSRSWDSRTHLYI